MESGTNKDGAVLIAAARHLTRRNCPFPASVPVPRKAKGIVQGGAPAVSAAAEQQKAVTAGCGCGIHPAVEDKDSAGISFPRVKPAIRQELLKEGCKSQLCY